MARAVLTDKPKLKTKSITQSDYPLVKIAEDKKLVKISETKRLVKIAQSKRLVKIAEGKRLVKIQQTLPFRVRFINITIPGYSFPNNVPPVGIAIIGFNNYIL
jgi:hypothetical protein